MQVKKFLYEVPVASTDFLSQVNFCSQSIIYTYEKDGLEFRSGIKFAKIKEMAHHGELTAEVWHIEDVYDTLVEIKNSEWVERIFEKIKRDSPHHIGYISLNHYMIYMDSVGCFEIIAESWEIIPEEPGKWNIVI